MAQYDEDKATYERLKAEIQAAFAAPDSDYVPMTAEDVFARNLDIGKAPPDGPTRRDC